MSPKQWLALLGFYVSYLFFGASIFYHWEQELETERRAEALAKRIEINELLVEHTAPHDLKAQRHIFDLISDYCEKPVTSPLEDQFEDPYVWTFFHSFFFSFTVISTVGYGNISPNNTTGRMFMIFYAIIGIPVSGMLYAFLGEFFGRVYIRTYRKYKQYKLSTNKHYVPPKISMIAQVALYLIPGVFIFIFLPAALFTIFEDWPYSLSVYYAFVTLTTIGFGDYVVTFQPHQEREFGVYFILYEIFVIFWVIFGLGYLVMIMGFVGRGMRSKRMARLEHQLAISLKETQNRIWTGVNKDVGYLRKVLNEVYLMKFKPVYREPGDMCANTIPRSASCPDLTIYRSQSYIARQRRSYSVCYSDEYRDYSQDGSMFAINRVQSDSDLSRIDKKRTFEAFNVNVVQPSELLAKVVTALGSIRSTTDDGSSVLDMAIGNRSGSVGVQGFSDSQILASERTWSGWSLPTSESSYMTMPSNIRHRTVSEVRLPDENQSSRQVANVNEWTWSGSNKQIQELMKQRKQSQRKQDLYRASFAASKMNNPQTEIDMPPPLNEGTRTPPSQNILSRLNPFKRRTQSTTCGVDGDLTPAAYLEKTARGRTSRISVPNQYLSDTQRGRPSVFSLSPQPEEQELLEKTTIADLIRAIEMLHTDANTSNESINSQPRRKHGLASLTPPRLPSLLTLFDKPPGYDMESGMANRRRSSIHPTVYSSIRRPQISTARRQSFAPSVTRQPLEQPPPYNASLVQSTPSSPLRRRFSVRPSNLSIPPGQAPKPIPSYLTAATTPQSTFQRKTSIRPSPLARDTTSRLSGRNMNWRPTPNQLQRRILESRTRHSSLSNLNENNGMSPLAAGPVRTVQEKEQEKRSRYDSK